MSVPLDVFAVSLVPCLLVWAVWTAWQFHSRQARVPTLGECRRAGGRTVAWARRELRDDYEDAQDRGTRLTLLTAAVETLLAPALLLRGAVHAAAYAAGSGRSPEMTVGLVADPIESRRPAWNRVLGALALACIGVWITQMYAVQPATLQRLGPLAATAWLTWTSALGVVIIGDPIVQLGDWLTDHFGITLPTYE